MATIRPRRGTTTPGTGAILQNELAVDTTNKRIYIGAANGSGTLIGSAPAGSDTQIQFNDGGFLGGVSGLTFNKTTNDLTIGGDLNVNGGDITTSTTTATIFNTTATTVNAFGAATTLTLGYTGTATSTTNISTGAVAAATTKIINIGTNGAGSSVTNTTIGSLLGTSTIYMQGTIVQYGPEISIFSSNASPDYIFMGTGKGGTKGIGVYADDPALSPVILTIDNQDGGGEIKIFGFAGYDYTVGYIYCDTPVFIAGDVVGNSNGNTIELNDNTGIFTIAANQLYMAASDSRIKFYDGSEQVTKTPDYLLFNMGII